MNKIPYLSEITASKTCSVCISFLSHAENNGNILGSDCEKQSAIISYPLWIRKYKLKVHKYIWVYTLVLTTRGHCKSEKKIFLQSQDTFKLNCIWLFVFWSPQFICFSCRPKFILFHHAISEFSPQLFNDRMIYSFKMNEMQGLTKTTWALSSGTKT